MNPILGQGMQTEQSCPFTERDVYYAFQQEVNLFLHVHMRGYDRKGEGLQMDASYYDKYGAPVNKEDAWIEGYHAIERELASHFNECANTLNDFPLVAGMAGGAHLYKPVGHDVEPWNWTGWVPVAKRWCSSNEFHYNRYFLNIRGNEIQNNLWDYHPFQEQNDLDDDRYEQITPLDKYQGGYWLYDDPWGRYIHIISIKSTNKRNGACTRYNYIVHPLAYRAQTSDIPDNSVDGMQWSILNIKHDGHFDDATKWGTDVQGLEIFNDFTYYFSWVAKHPNILIQNGELMNYMESDDSPKKKYIYWFDTYPLEFGEFLIDTALRQRIYFHIIAANDAFYNRDVVPPYAFELDDEAQKLLQAGERRLLSDPKGAMLKTIVVCPVQQPEDYLVKVRELEEQAKEDAALRKSLNFLKSRPYNIYTAFGHTTILDPHGELGSLISKKKFTISAFENAENTTLDWLQEGKFYSHTGAYNLFKFTNRIHQQIPYIIKNQPDNAQMCYRFTRKMELIFTFAPCTEFSENLVWKYAIQYQKTIEKEDHTTFVSTDLETAEGYFNLHKDFYTRLNLRDSYRVQYVRWIRFTAFRPDNPQRRAWFNPIQGPDFNLPFLGNLGYSMHNPISAMNTPLTHKINVLKVRKVVRPTAFGEEKTLREFYEEKSLETFACKRSEDKPTKLEFLFPKCSPEQEKHIYAYNMQAMALQPQLNKNTENTRRKSDGSFYLPPRFLQDVCGYFRLNQLYPTKLKMAYQWDADTVKDNTVHFYCVDVKTRQARQIDKDIQPEADMPEGYAI